MKQDTITKSVEPEIALKDYLIKKKYKFIVPPYVSKKADNLGLRLKTRRREFSARRIQRRAHYDKYNR